MNKTSFTQVLFSNCTTTLLQIGGSVTRHVKDNSAVTLMPVARFTQMYIVNGTHHLIHDCAAPHSSCNFTGQVTVLRGGQQNDSGPCQHNALASSLVVQVDPIAWGIESLETALVIDPGFRPEANESPRCI